MSVFSAPKIIVSVLVGLVLSVSVLAAPYGVGFQASLVDPLEVHEYSVAHYYEHPNRLSVANPPLTFATLSRDLLYNPVVRGGSFDSTSLRFEAKYYRGELVPISVDAHAYYNYRIEKLKFDRQRQSFSRNYQEAKRGEGGQGLSIGVNLPKRFDQMFGEGGANLRVSGYRRITFSGRSQWNDDVNTSLVGQSRFPSLNMEQISRFDITGTIGTKISVKVSQDNQTDIPLANRLLIRYKGDEDDIIKTIEAGNTTLSLPNTRFVGYSSRIQGLFGLKAEAQLGNLTVTAIASQEKGSSESASVSATGEENADYIRDYAYAEGRVFDLFYRDEKVNGEPISPRDSIRNIQVYQWTNQTDDLGQIGQAWLMINPDQPLSQIEFRDSVQTKILEPTDYTLLYNQDSLRSPIAIHFYQTQRRPIGVYMEVARYPGYTKVDTVGALGSGGVDQVPVDTLKSIMTNTSDFRPSHPTWNLMWRNCYRVRAGLDIEDISVKVFKGLPGREGTTSSRDYQVASGSNRSDGQYLEILGLDQYNNNLRTKQPDGLLDNRQEIFRSDLGLVIFPSREPFNSDTTFTDTSGDVTVPLALLVPTIYDYESTTEKTDNSQYYIQISTTARSSVIRLGRANVIENSERVTLNGNPLQKDVDYTIQYDFGQVTLLSDEALDPNADVRVEFQYAPFLALQKKTLLGMRAEYEWSRDLKFGSTVLYKSDKAQERKPRVGQETAEALILDVDGAMTLRPNFLTSMVDALPLVSTEAESRLQITGEMAQSRPNPNVEGEAYIDDFESAVETITLGIGRGNWTLASQPVAISDYNLDGANAEKFARGTIRWHNPPRILRSEVFAGDIAAGEDNLEPFRMIYRPRPNVPIVVDSQCTGSFVSTKSWGGIMRYIAGRVDAKRVQLFEFRAKGGKGIIHFDFGTINEDINGNGRTENEDRSLPPNGSLEEDEDTGLDLIENNNEVNECGEHYNGTTNPDPAGDNWWFLDGNTGKGLGAGENNERPPVPQSIWNSSGYQARVKDVDDWLHYEWVNGTEGNRIDGAGKLPDNEQLGGFGAETNNAYFTIAIDLAMDTLDPNSYYKEGSARNGWKTYSIPVRAPGVMDSVAESVEIQPSWADISHARVWFEQPQSSNQGIDSLASMDSLWIAEWGFVQSNWQDTLIAQAGDQLSEFFVKSVSEEDGTFTPPPGVEAYYDKVNNVTETQKGLAMTYNNFSPGALGYIQRDLINTESYSGYRKMEMYVYGPANIGSDQVQFFLRIGLDSLNFYEYHSTLKPGWDEDNFVDIDFNELTALKDAAEQKLENRLDPIDTTAGSYRVVGRPNINEIRVIQAGMNNLGSSRISGEIWIDELRLTNVRKDVGTAARVAVTGSAADLLTYSFGYEHRDPYFRGLAQATRGGSQNNLGSGRETNSINYGVTLNTHKFLPRSWNARIPVSVNYSQAEDIPLLRNNSDVILPDEIRQEEKAVSKSFKFTVNESFNKRGSNLLFNAVLNRQKVSFSYNRSDRTTVNNPFVLGENYNMRAEYDMGIRTPVEIPIFFWANPVPFLKKLTGSKFSLFPDQWRWNATYNRSLQLQDDQDFIRTSSFSRTLDGQMTIAYRPFANLTTNYGMTTRRDLTDDKLINLSLKNPKLGLENNYSQNFRATYDPKLLRFLTSQFSYDSRYNDRYDRSTSSISTSLQRSWSISGMFRHQDLLGGGGGQAVPRRGTVQGRATQAEEEQGKPFYAPVLAGLRFLTNWLNPVSYRYDQSFAQSVPGALNKPALKYRFGISTSTDFPVVQTNQNPSSSERVSYDFGSGFTLLTAITTTVNYRRTVGRDLVVIGRDRFENRSTSWPDLTIRIQKFRTLPFIKPYLNWFIDIFAPRTGYSRTITEDYNLSDGFSTGKTETISRNPVLSINFKVFRNLSVTGSYSTTETNEDRRNRINGVPLSETITTRTTYGVSGKYQFSAPGGIGIPLLGRLKFNSTVTIDVNVKFSSNLSETSTKSVDATGVVTDGPFVVGTDDSDFSVSPVISYNFSQQIRGGLTARWQDNNNAKFDRKSHVRELQIWTEIRF